MGTLYTMNNHWGYCNFDHQYIPQMLVRKLAECASKGGNMIPNVGPDARNIPEESVQILTEVEKWMKKMGRAFTDAEFPNWKAGLGKIYPER